MDDEQQIDDTEDPGDTEPQGMMRSKINPLSYQRKCELIDLAKKLAEDVESQTKPGQERCFLREMVQMIVRR